MPTSSTPEFTHLIRFEDEDGVVQWGDLAGGSAQENLIGTKVDVLEGSLEGGFSTTDATKRIAKVGQCGMLQ